jgi:ribosome recycling factor
MAEFDATRNDMKRRMESAMEVLHREFAGLRTGRASINLLEPLIVEAYGQKVPITQVGTVGVPEPRMLTVQVWDRALVTYVEKAIRDSNLGLNPQSDGQLVRVPIPPLTEDRRKEITKIASRYTEEAKVAVRNVRRHGLDELKKFEKDGKVSQDESKKITKDIQDMTDGYVKKLDDAFAHKEKEILQV